jgi:hypothetical protein
VGKLFNIEKLEAGGDPFKNWLKLNEIIDALNDLSVTIVPGELATVRIEDGDIQLSFNAPPPDNNPTPPVSGSGDQGSGITTSGSS